jgi:hypothetical protein
MIYFKYAVDPIVGGVDRFGKLDACMSETINQNLSGVSETLLVTLYLRAMESSRLEAML